MTEIDLRSDTVTRPTDEMRKAMAEAPVGDDVYGEDPTINRLQDMAAERFDREAALFVPSGSMGNQVAVWTHTNPGDEVILEADCHIFNYEMATMSAFSGVMPRPIPTEKGVLSPAAVKEALREDIYYLSETSLVTLENTHNNHGGRIYPLSDSRAMIEFAEENGLNLHLDGARIFNASVGSGYSVEDLTEGFDSVMFCLSKGLGAPVGSMLVGDRYFIDQARSARKRFGGGMRQAGILAAAGIYALNNNVQRLEKDHENAARLAEGLRELGFEVTPTPPQTNIIFVDTSPIGVNALDLTTRLKEKGILIGGRNETTIRFVTHLDIDREDIDQVLEVIGSDLQE